MWSLRAARVRKEAHFTKDENLMADTLTLEVMDSRGGW
jgi:hypothetical protein